MAVQTRTQKTPTINTPDELPDTGERVRYSMSFVTQGKHRFYTLTMPSDVLANCCFATNREEDPVEGFQRVLDDKRAQEIADYMDMGFGTIPSSIILSAQPDAQLKDVGKGKTLEFTFSKHSFLIIDGQHRVFGFAKANTKLRVPVVIYNGLSKQEESRLFIDINTKQRPVPNELLLDIKKLANFEDDKEIILGDLFDTFNTEQDSPLLGLLSPSQRSSGKLSRVTFYAAVKPVLTAFATNSASLIYPALKSYIKVFYSGLSSIGAKSSMVNPVVFRAIFEIFPEIAQRVMDRHGASFKEEAFNDIMINMFSRIKPALIIKPPRSHKELAMDLSKALKSGFIIG
ncbi:DGQHR domain-containing protein [Pseudomonas viridiflava]|uniref:DGQHR domain-containing protein n=1 Tax=Pseudomonas viridiflava TaxID=33069 RepID=UPI0009B79FA0|nr:DGQHR domain-containing protein [Pseudomonas viridiflava]